MRSTGERYHQYRICPRCENDVLGSHRFCRKCSYWLARPSREDIRSIDTEPGARKSWFVDNWLVLRGFQASLSRLLAGVILGVGAMLMLIYLINEIAPRWLMIGPMAKQRVCYSNNRLIRNAIEMYCQDHKFTRELASDPAHVLWKAGYLNAPPQCPVKGNRYEYFFKSATEAASAPFGLICVGSMPHGLAE